MKLRKLLESCHLCPRKCGVNRINGQTGACNETLSISAARAALHMWEEPCISGENGSGAVFFSGCSLGCAYCQNHDISGGLNGKEITIKLACYREVNRFIDLLRNRPDRRGTIVESIDFTDYKALPMDPVNCFEHEQTDYTKYDELVRTLQLSALELAILNCYMNGMVQSEVCAELGIGRGTINFRKASIRKRYFACFGSL